MVDAGMLGAMNVQTTDYRRLSEADRHPRLYMHTAYTSYMYLGYISFWSSGSIHQKVQFIKKSMCDIYSPSRFLACGLHIY